MNKACIALILTLTLVSAYPWRGDTSGDAYRDAYGGTYRDLHRNRRSDHGKNSGRAEACANAAAGFNRGIAQLVVDITAQSNKWVVYSDLDALDEVSYYLSQTCENHSLELVKEEKDGQTQTQNKACDNLFRIVASLLEQDETHAFRGGYEKGRDLSVAALKAGRNLGDGCQVELRPAQAEEEGNQEEFNLDEENDESGEEGLDEKADWNIAIFATSDNVNDNDDCESDNDDNDNDNDDSDDSDCEDDDDNSDDSDCEEDDDDDDDSDNSDCEEDDDDDDESDDSDCEEDDDDNDESDDSDCEDDDDDDNDDGNGFSWSYDNDGQGVRIRIDNTEDDHKDGYKVTYDPEEGISVEHFSAEESSANEEASSEEWSTEEWDSEEANDEEWDDDDESADLKDLRKIGFLSFVTRYYNDQW